MTKKEKKQLVMEAAKLKGRRSVRYISIDEIEEMARLDRKKSVSGKNIRVYSSDGFVPGSYKYPATIDYVYRTYIDGKKKFSIHQGDASRRHGSGALVCVGNRSYNG